MTNRLAYRLTPEAQADLKSIRRYTIKEWGLVQSRKYFSEIRNKLQFIADSPHIGLIHTELGEAIFSFPCQSHMIYYTVVDNQVIAFAILHKNMAPMNHIEGRNF
jgi:toxin ParE1/3/4